MVNCGRRETFEEEDANGVGKVKGIFTLSCKKGNRQGPVGSHPAIPGVDFQKQAFVLSVFLRFSLILFIDFFNSLRVACVIHMCVFHLWP